MTARWNIRDTLRRLRERSVVLPTLLPHVKDTLEETVPSNCLERCHSQIALSVPIKSGEKIDAGTPERPIAADELAMLQRIADSFHQRFIDQVQSVRPQLSTVEDQWTDGNVMTGAEAESIGMVDGVVYLDSAIQWARDQAGMKPEDRVVMFRRQHEHAYTPLDIAVSGSVLNSLIPIHVPGLDRSSMPTFLYMWQADPSMATKANP